MGGSAKEAYAPGSIHIRERGQQVIFPLVSVSITIMMIIIIKPQIAHHHCQPEH